MSDSMHKRAVVKRGQTVVKRGFTIHRKPPDRSVGKDVPDLRDSVLRSGSSVASRKCDTVSVKRCSFSQTDAVCGGACHLGAIAQAWSVSEMSKQTCDAGIEALRG